ncbi:hypothetical protein LOK49_LG06G01762 [Camellia lanceoleosa]|uniref:Uncharacterized protein n=1 Tax=Camellia lanceoleosa TaxID=1840588 RepID=A0ACC0HBU8_9ERIC|nr:hypothetical protein LOK49_LG06G01762 [Camellia lanceoleosa]
MTDPNEASSYQLSGEGDKGSTLAKNGREAGGSFIPNPAPAEKPETLLLIPRGAMGGYVPPPPAAASNTASAVGVTNLLQGLVHCFVCSRSEFSSQPTITSTTGF